MHRLLNSRPPEKTKLLHQKNSGKTSLLFHYARSVAESTGRPVYFLKSAAAAQAGPPLLPATAAASVGSGGQGPAAAAAAAAAAAGGRATEARDPFDLVQMKYVSSIADVVAFAACLHLLESDLDEAEGGGRGRGRGQEGPPSSSSRLPRRPAAVVVDGLSSLPPDEDSAAASSRSIDRRAVEHAVLRALAVLSDATAGAWRGRKGEERTGGGERGEGGEGGAGGDKSNDSSSSAAPLPPIALVVAEEAAPDGRAPFYLYRRWLPLILAVRPAAQEGFRSSHHHRSLLSLAPLPAASGGAYVSHASSSAAALYAFEGAGELEAVGVAV